MREYIFIPEHKTSVLPLRWLANYVFHPVSMWFFSMGLKANDQLEYDYPSATLLDEIKEKIGFKVYNFLNHPYDWWGTTYILDKNLLSDITGLGWDDYDENGIPYWDYFWHEDPETGDGWRLVNKKDWHTNGASN